MKRIAIFKTGTHTATNGDTLSFTEDYLKDVVASYNPTIHESPAVIGHPKDNHPAYGWVKSLSFDEGTGTLYADFDQVDANFEAMLKAGRFKKRSASFYPATHPSNPTTGKPYLRHVGFLGAQPPAVKGLPDFSEEKECPVIEFAELPPVTDTQSASQTETQPQTETKKDTTMGDTKTPNDNTNPSQDSNPANTTTQTANAPATPTDSELAAKEAALKAREAAIAAKEAEFAKQQQDAKAQNFSEFAESLIGTGQLVPAEKTAIVDVLMDLDASSKTFDFSENGTVTKKSPLDVFKGLLGRLNTTVDFGERTSDDPNTAAKPQYGTPDTNDVLHQKILDYAEKHGVSYTEAVQKLSSQ